MTGFWEKIFDYSTRIDDILSQFFDAYKVGNKQLIEAVLTGEEPETPESENKHIPFFIEGTVEGGDTDTLLIKADPEQGLGEVGRSGYFANDSDEYVHLIIDGGRGKSKKIRVDAGERLAIDRSDNIWIDKLTVDAGDARAAVDYRCSFSR